jgi:hypothetical protein
MPLCHYYRQTLDLADDLAGLVHRFEKRDTDTGKRSVEFVVFDNREGLLGV